MDKTPTDPAMTLSGIAEDALVGYLHTATLCTVDLESYTHFYVDAMKMQIEGPFPLSEEEKTEQRLLWKIPKSIDYDLYHIYRTSVPSLIHLRVLHLKTSTPHIHSSYSSYESGSFSLGFPSSNVKAMDKRMEEYGIKAMAPMLYGDIVRDNGTVDYYYEKIYKGPDFLHCVGIERVDIPQLAPCDPEDGFGGPGYTGFVAKDSDAEIAFFTKVLGFNMLFDRVWETQEGTPLGIEGEVPFRFVALYSPGSKQNHILLLDFKNGKTFDTGVPGHVPSQGLGMYTFMTRNINQVVDNAKANSNQILSKIRVVSDVLLGKGKACLLQTPNGFYIEIFQQL